MDNDLGALVHAGGWEIDLATNALSWSPEVYRINEVADDFFPTVERAIAFYDEASRQAITGAVDQAVTRAVPFDLTLVVLTAKGRLRKVREVGSRKRRADGHPVAVYGTFQDSTEVVELQNELRETRSRYAALFETMAGPSLPPRRTVPVSGFPSATPSFKIIRERCRWSRLGWGPPLSSGFLPRPFPGRRPPKGRSRPDTGATGGRSSSMTKRPSEKRSPKSWAASVTTPPSPSLPN